MVTTDNFDKEKIIDTLLQNNVFKMSDGRQLYEASATELQKELCLRTDNQFPFCYA